MRIKARHAVPQSPTQTVHGHLSTKAPAMSQSHGYYVSVTINGTQIICSLVRVFRHASDNRLLLIDRCLDLARQLASVIRREQFLHGHVYLLGIAKQFKPVLPRKAHGLESGMRLGIIGKMPI